MLTKHTKWLVLPLSLFVLTAAYGAPSINKPSIHFIDWTLSPSSELYVPFVPEVSQVAELSHLRFANVAKQYLGPPVSVTNPATPAVGATSLPAVPGAVLMVVIGFACVSLVKDRKVWLGALAGLLWAGQAGMQALPQWASRLSNKTHKEQQLAVALTYPCGLEESSRLRSDIEGTQYIGLLHHLAGIPGAVVASLHQQEFTQAKDKSRVPGSAIIQFSSSVTATNNWSAWNVEQFTCLTPAFIFENLPRGPPTTA